MKGFLQRRTWLSLAAGALAGRLSWGAEGQMPSRPPLPVRSLIFPRDHGAHLDAKTEWWYLTGWLRKPDSEAGSTPDYGFQLTFFRSAVDSTQGMKSNFAAKHLVFAHAALTEIQSRKFWHDQRMTRFAGSPATDLATVGLRSTQLELRDWSLKREAGSRDSGRSVYRAALNTPEFGLNVRLETSQEILLQGEGGLSRKGPQAAQTSFYYSQPQLALSGQLSLSGKTRPVQGTAWLDHEWSNEMLPPQAVGWDWIGMNLDDGSALTAFQIRDQAGLPMWGGGSWRSANRVTSTFQPGDVSFKPIRLWKSPKSQAQYPTEWQVRTPTELYTVRALVDNQELDSRASTGAIYWEGLCALVNSQHHRVGYGYLEMTGYAQPLRF